MQVVFTQGTVTVSLKVNSRVDISPALLIAPGGKWGQEGGERITGKMDIRITDKGKKEKR